MRYNFFALCATATLLFAAASCKPETNPKNEGKALATPQLTIADQTETSFTIAWDAVENAAGYAYTINTDAEVPTAETSVSFSDLAAGTYTVKVKATAPADSETWKDSEYATIDVVLEEGGVLPENAITFTTQNITATSAVVTTIPYNNEILYFSDLMPMSDFTNEKEVIADYLDFAAQYADSYGVGIKDLAYQGEDEYEFTGLAPETEYINFGFIINEKGEAISGLYTSKFTTSEMPPADPELEKWVGTWTATSASTFKWNVVDGKLTDEMLEGTQTTATFRMEINPNDTEQLLIYGWTPAGSTIPAYAILNDDGTTLDVLTGIQVGNTSSSGTTPIWMSYSYFSSESKYYFLSSQTPAYTITLDGNSAKAVPVKANFDNNPDDPYEVNHIGVYGSSSNGISIYQPENGWPAMVLAGEITLTKTAASNAVKGNEVKFLRSRNVSNTAGSMVQISNAKMK